MFTVPPEIIEALVEGDHDAGAFVQAELDHDVAAPRLPAMLGVEIGDMVLDGKRRLHGRGGLGEGRHDSIADGLDDGALVLAHLGGEKGEMIAHQMIGGGIADALVERGRALEIGEHQGHLGDGDLIPRPQHIAAEEIAEGLERRQPVGGEAVAQPAAVLDDGDPRPVAAVDQRDLPRRRREGPPSRHRM